MIQHLRDTIRGLFSGGGQRRPLLLIVLLVVLGLILFGLATRPL